MIGVCGVVSGGVHAPQPTPAPAPAASITYAIDGSKTTLAYDGHGGLSAGTTG